MIVALVTSFLLLPAILSRTGRPEQAVATRFVYAAAAALQHLPHLAQVFLNLAFHFRDARQSLANAKW